MESNPRHNRGGDPRRNTQTPWNNAYHNRGTNDGGYKHPSISKHIGDYEDPRRRKVDSHSFSHNQFTGGSYRQRFVPEQQHPDMQKCTEPRYETIQGHLQHRSDRNALRAKRNGAPSKAIGLFGLGAYVTEEDVTEFLKEKVCEVQKYKVVIVYDKYRKVSKGYGFLQFETLDDAITTKKKLVGQTIKGKEIRIDYSIE
ncbi:hypothetical protein HK407_06g11370 [Ordospora pajunii]|uniref:uncharacterized protein n=1 Tax=Ordospora pajunii TaxID=3039483 RepID=UPI00295268F6|nr:uncharacterized protein HK407_06g11370 [Ordospora pajunii]KAH9411306.1 hypothetical protein HK407_06g11370 [Ordospora pajunii]